jgi:hypothetical protein
LDATVHLAGQLATHHDAVTMLTLLRPGPRDLTVPPRFQPPPVPVSYTADGTHHPLGDGTDPSAWDRVRRLGAGARG